MKTKPWPIVILAFLHILAPLPNVLFSAFLQGVNPLEYMHTFQSISEMLTYLMFFPLAGVAIYACKRWSIPVFIGVMGWGMYVSYQSWLLVPDRFPFFVLVGAFLVNTAVVTYFLIPEVKRVYFDSTVRWWERLPRYRVIFGAEMARKSDGETLKCTILDLSEGGVFIKVNDEMKEQEDVRLSFAALGMEFAIDGKIVHLGTEQRPGYGIQFMNRSREDLKQIRRLTRALEVLGNESNQNGTAFPSGFSDWYKTLVKTGKGLVPQYYDSKKPVVAKNEEGKKEEQAQNENKEAA